MRPPRKPLPTLSDQIRAAIARSGSLYELAEATGVDRGILSRFARGERTITLATADRLVDALKLRLTAGR